MPQLTQLDVLEIGVSVRIMDRIGSDYHTLGTYLLNDKDGGMMRMIKRDYKFTEEILDEIFHRWIKGQGQKDGKKMNTWESLVKCLKHSKFMALADEIEAVLHFCTEKALRMDHDECQEHIIYETLMETKTLLQKLIPMLAAIIVGAAVIILLYHYRSKHNVI